MVAAEFNGSSVGAAAASATPLLTIPLPQPCLETTSNSHHILDFLFGCYFSFIDWMHHHLTDIIFVAAQKFTFKVAAYLSEDTYC